MKSILGIGNALTDILVVMPDDAILKKYSLPAGSMQWVDSHTAYTIWEEIKNRDIQIVPGGSAANTISGTSILGLRSGFIGKVGDDEIGRLFGQGQTENGIRPILLKGKDSSGRAMVFITPPNSERTFADYMGAALELSADDLKEEYFAGYDILYVEGYLVQSQDLVRRAVEIGKKLGMTIALDLASYNVVESNYDFLYGIIKDYIDIVFANESEARSFTHLAPEEALDTLAGLCNVAVVKVGPRGAFVKSGGSKIKIEACPATKVDSTVAGDMFAAGFLYGYAQELPLDICGKIGSLVSSKVIEVIGTRMSDTTWKTIKEKVEAIISQR